MKLKEAERIAICRVLQDIAEEKGASISITECHHYHLLKERAYLVAKDFETARTVSVLSSLVILKGMHYNVKMLLALTVCDLYSEHEIIPLDCRIAFETLMSAIDWSISFSEVLAMGKTI